MTMRAAGSGGTADAKRRPAWRLGRLVLALTLMLGIVAVPAPAQALPSETPDQTWQVNGPVWALAKFGDTIFLGGTFTELREEPVGSAFGQVIAVNNFAALSASTGAPIPSMFVDPPDFEGSAIIYTLTVAGGKLWAGGRFKTVDGVRRYNLAALDPTTLSLDPLKPRFSGIVQALEGTSTTMFAGGKFTKVNGIPRTRLAALSFDGVLDPSWTPSAAAKVQDVAVTPDGTGLFISGDFKSVSDPSGVAFDRNSLARLSTSTGSVMPWVAGAGTKTYSVRIRGRSVNVIGDRVYWAVAQSDWAAAFNVDTGEQIFKTDTDGTVGDIVEMDGNVFIGGHFLLVAPQPGISGCATKPGLCPRHVRIAALSLSGVLDQSWNAGLDGHEVEWEGTRRFLVDGSHLYVGGEFLGISGVDQSYFGRLS